MSEPKRHHYVPQFYLRRFASHKAAITCFHKATGRTIPNAPIKGQCAVNNFYAWEASVEKRLSAIEGRIAAILRQIDATGDLPNQGSMEYQELLVGVALQSSRTQLAGKESDEMADHLFKTLHQHEAKSKGIDLSLVKIASKYPAALPMEIAAEAFPLLNTLDAVLLHNNTALPFFASDHPVAFYNSRLSHVEGQGVIGLTSQGLQVFYPLSPSLCLCLFDAETYKNPSNTRRKKIRLNDAIKINLISYMWSDNVLFGEDVVKVSRLEPIANVCRPFLPFERTIQMESEQQPLEDDQLGSLLVSYRAHCPVHLKFDFIRERDDVAAAHNFIRGIDAPNFDGPVRTYRFNADVTSRDTLSGNQLSRAINEIAKAYRR